MEQNKSVMRGVYVIVALIFFACAAPAEEKEIAEQPELEKEEKQYKPFFTPAYDYVEFDWNEIACKVTETEKEEYIKDLARHFSYYIESPFYIGDFGDKIHFVHLNGDDRPDAIFHGWSGGEPDNLQFFIQNDEGFEPWFDLFADPVAMTFENRKLSRVITIDRGCCDAYMTQVDKYNIEESPELTANYAFIHWTDMKGEKMEPVRFEVENTPYHLRDYPAIKTEFMIDRFEDTELGNVIASLQAGDKGWAFKKRTDEEGREWWLVQTDPLDKVENSIFYANREVPTAYVGWLSSRFVKVIEE